MNINTLYIFIILILSFPSRVLPTELKLNTYFQNNSPPRYIEFNQKTTGICIDIIDEINKRLESKKIIITNPNQIKVPMKRIIKYIELNKEIDIFVGAAKNQARINHVGKYSTPLFSIIGTFAKNKTNDFFYSGKDSLKGLSTGVLRGSISESMLQDIAGVNVVPTNTIEQSLRMLAANRIDLVYYHDLGLNWQIRSLKLNKKIEVVNAHQYLEQGHQYILYTNRVSKEVITKINKVITSMHADGSMHSIIKKYQ